MSETVGFKLGRGSSLHSKDVYESGWRDIQESHSWGSVFSVVPSVIPAESTEGHLTERLYDSSCAS